VDAHHCITVDDIRIVNATIGSIRVNPRCRRRQKRVTRIASLDLPALQSLADFDVSPLRAPRITIVPGEGHVCPRRNRHNLRPRPHRRNKTNPKTPAFSTKAFPALVQLEAPREHGKA
jgi:hypothetical protein